MRNEELVIGNRESAIGNRDWKWGIKIRNEEEQPESATRIQDRKWDVLVPVALCLVPVYQDSASNVRLSLSVFLCQLADDLPFPEAHRLNRKAATLLKQRHLLETRCLT